MLLRNRRVPGTLSELICRLQVRSQADESLHCTQECFDAVVALSDSNDALLGICHMSANVQISSCASSSFRAQYAGPDSQAASPAQDLSLREDLGSFGGSAAQEEGRMYNPYEGLSTAVDPRILRSVYKLPNQPEFLFSEEATVHRRSWSENLTYYTGTGYLAGLPCVPAEAYPMHGVTAEDRIALLSM